MFHLLHAVSRLRRLHCLDLVASFCPFKFAIWPMAYWMWFVQAVNTTIIQIIEYLQLSGDMLHRRQEFNRPNCHRSNAHMVLRAVSSCSLWQEMCSWSYFLSRACLDWRRTASKSRWSWFCSSSALSRCWSTTHSKPRAHIRSRSSLIRYQFSCCDWKACESYQSSQWTRAGNE